MEQRVFNKFRSLIYEKAGIQLRDGKEALVAARVGKRMRALGLQDYQDYLKRVEADEKGDELVQLLDVISTNVTSFFRESEHFDFITEVFQNWVERGQKRFRFWSAACSSGEEPYTLGMVLHETGLMGGLDVRILATDISTQVLAKAKAGVYPIGKLKGVPAGHRMRYFSRRADGEDSMAVTDTLKRMVVYTRLNLSTPPFPMSGPMDIILCRNVMIYFDNVVRQSFLAEAQRLLRPGGYLLVGHAESLTGMLSDFKPVRPSIYRKE